MGEPIDQQLLSLGAEEETLEQPRGVRIGGALEYAGGNDDQGRTFGGVHHLDRLALILLQHQIFNIALPPNPPPPVPNFFLRARPQKSRPRGLAGRSAALGCITGSRKTNSTRPVQCLALK